MSTLDMEVIKEIPGYKVILKAVLKAQIQQLVEQLAAHTEEESVILTASLADGTLSHLGSDSGKSFLDDHEDVKSQFLGFCLRKHHCQKQAEKEHVLHNVPPIPTHYEPGPGPRMNFIGHNSRPMFPRQSTPRRLVTGIRHEPYPVFRPVHRNSTEIITNFDSSTVKLPQNNSNTSKVKLEPDVSSDGANNDLISNNVSQVSYAPSQTHTESKDDDVSNSSTSTIPNDVNDGKFNDSVTQNCERKEEVTQNKTDGSDVNPDISVKIEAVTEAEMELEITGVELGRHVTTQDNWGTNTSGAMNFDPSGATGNQSDLLSSPQGYNDNAEPLVSRRPRVTCVLCQKDFANNRNLNVHLRTHTGEKPYRCDICFKRFSTKSNMRAHTIVHINSNCD